MKRRAFVVGALLVVVAGVVLRLTIGKQRGAPAPGGRQGGARGPVAVAVEPVAFGPIREERNFTGAVKAAYTYVVAAKISGRLLSVTKRIGDKVGRDEVLGRIDDSEYRGALDEAEAQTRVSKASVAEARAQLAQSERDQRRVAELVAKGISSQAELEAAQTQLASLQSRLELALAQLAQREAALELARTRFDYTRLRSASPGYVAERNVDGGAQLSVNTPVYTVVGIDTVYVEIGVTEREYSLVRMGQAAAISVDALPGREFRGIIAHRAPLFQTSSRTATAEVSIVNDSLLLKPGMFATIKVVLAEKDSAQLVPVSAVVTRGGASAVFVLDDSSKTVGQVQVTTGLSNSKQVEIVSPRIEGKVVTLGNHLLVDGASVITGQPAGSGKGGAPNRKRRS